MANIEGERHLQVQEISERNMHDFQSWRQEQDAFQTLEFPNSVGNVFILTRILELSEDPTNVRAIVRHWDDAHYIIVAEHMPSGLTNEAAFQKWVDETRGKRPALRDPYNSMEAPSGIDHMHVKHLNDVLEGRVGLDDKIYLYYGMKMTAGYPHIVEAINLFDRPELHGTGIGTSFYARLESVLKALGFEYLAGQIWSPNPGFFAKSRKRYVDFDEADREKLPAYFGKDIADQIPSDWMIKKL